MSIKLFTAVAAVAALGTTAHAHAITLTQDFESGTGSGSSFLVVDNGGGFPNITDTAVNSAGFSLTDEVTTNGPAITSQSGVARVSAPNYDDPTPSGGIIIKLGSLATFDVASLDSTNAADYTLSYDIAASGTDTNDFELDLDFLDADGNLLTSLSFAEPTVANVNGNAVDSFNLNLADLGNSGSFAGVAADVRTIVVDAQGVLYYDGIGNQYSVAIDNVVFDGPASIPEPASLALLGLGGLALRRRR